jgi:hypothetical protein
VTVSAHPALRRAHQSIGAPAFIEPPHTMHVRSSVASRTSALRWRYSRARRFHTLDALLFSEDAFPDVCDDICLGRLLAQQRVDCLGGPPPVSDGLDLGAEAVRVRVLRHVHVPD